MKELKEIDKEIMKYGTFTLGIGIITQYGLHAVNKIESLAFYIPEIVKNYEPSVPDLFYLAIPAGIIGGMFNYGNKRILKKIEKERIEEQIERESSIKNKI